jgi:hypothetical protein
MRIKLIGKYISLFTGIWLSLHLCIYQGSRNHKRSRKSIKDSWRNGLKVTRVAHLHEMLFVHVWPGILELAVSAIVFFGLLIVHLLVSVQSSSSKLNNRSMFKGSPSLFTHRPRSGFQKVTLSSTDTSEWPLIYLKVFTNYMIFTQTPALIDSGSS